MHTYTILTDGKQTHRLHAENLPESVSAVFQKADRGFTGPMGKAGFELYVVSVSDDATRNLGESCPKVGQRFPTIADAARAIGCKLNSLYQSRKRAGRRDAGAYSIWGIEMGLVTRKQKSMTTGIASGDL